MFDGKLQYCCPKSCIFKEAYSYRSKKFPIFYLDETWRGSNHARNFGWVEKVDKHSCFDSYNDYRSSVQQVFGERGGFARPTGPGKRIIILHIGNKDGFLEGAMDCFVGKTGCNDYHKEMNAAHFNEWFTNMLPLLPPNSVVVLDQAPYHTMLDPEFRNPTTKWRVAEIIQWLRRRPVPLPDNEDSFEAMSKAELLNLSRKNKYEKKYLLDKTCKNLRDDVKLLWLPVAHCEVNPIELIWAYVKNKVAKENVPSNHVDRVCELCKEVMNNLPPDLWEKCETHAKKYEDFYKTSTTLSDSVEPLIIELTDSDFDEISDSCASDDSD